MLVHLPTFYDRGTASVSSGATTVTGNDTLWGDGTLLAGDRFTVPSQPLVPPQRIASITSNGELELAVPWPGANVAGAPYEVRYAGIIERSTAQTRRYLEMLGDIGSTGVGINAFGTFAGRAAYNDRPANFVYLSTNGNGSSITYPLVYIKQSSASGDWGTSIDITGPQGPSGLIGVWRGAWAAGTAYALKDVVRVAGTSYICEIAHTSGTFATDYGAGRWSVVAQRGDVGLSYNRSTSTADSDPGNGNFRFNNATLASATQLFIDLIDTDGVTQTGFLDAWNEGTSPSSKGQLYIRLRDNPSVFYVYNVTGVTTASGYRKIAIQYLSGSGTIANTAACVLSFMRAGDKGQDGMGTGDVVGPGGATSSNVAIFSGPSGKAIADSGIAASDIVRAGTAQVVTGRKTFSAGGTGDSSIAQLAGGGGGEIAINGNGVGAAVAQYHRPSGHITYFGLDTDNQFKRGGGSLAGVARMFFDQGNILGNVAQASGVPTGALIERGSNANGEYVKFADGMMICRRVWDVAGLAVNTGNGSLFFSAAQTWTFPAAFATGVYPVITGSARIGGVLCYVHPNSTSDNSTGDSIYVVSSASVTGTAHIRLVAIGRWF
ncbi:carbohydrate-binding protein [Devosia geojensis]|uniref:carbohydrate-binding protein n=1 Tax=Devosia geojensis TaxID=443610 RepID=UPI000698BF2A|nr:carbohydrate-binding protein [Devosia geojensis]